VLAAIGMLILVGTVYDIYKSSRATEDNYKTGTRPREETGSYINGALSDSSVKINVPENKTGMTNL
jgi:hypothetical protein